MKFVFISDTHGDHNNMYYPIPEGDVLIHAGDLTNVGTQNDIQRFVEWYQNLTGFDTKIFIAGNHDWGFYHKRNWLQHLINDENLSQSDCVYLEDSELIIETPELSKPIKFYGSPWQPRFLDWAYNATEEQLFKIWKKIPNDTDILITHSPAHSILDKVVGRHDQLGSVTLYNRIMEIKPKIHVCGHIHSGRGVMEKDGIVFINASVATESYDMIYKPIVIDYDFNTNKWELIDM